MTGIRARLADAIFTETTRIVFTSTGEDVEKRVAAIMSMSAQQLADVLLSLPDIAIVGLPSENLKLTQFWAVAYGDGYTDGEVTYEHWDSARDALDEALESYSDAHLVTFWATGAVAAANRSEQLVEPEPLNYSGLDRSCDDYYGMGT